MTTLSVQDSLSKYLVSNNKLGAIYRIPSNEINIDTYEIMKHFIGCEIKYKGGITEVIVAHKLGDLNELV